MGRPRSEKSQESILRAAFQILIARGYAGFTIEAVAAAANAGKTTIYRWWPTKAELAVDAFFNATTDELSLPESQSAEADFRSQIGELGDLLRGERGQAFAAMLGGARTDPALAKALGERWLEPRRHWGFARMMRAAAQGQLQPDAEPAAALAVLYGPIYAPLLFGGQVPDARAIDSYLDIASRGIFIAPLK